jgi:hypothetical protein
MNPKIVNIKGLAEIFGEKSVFYISQDDKARIPLGLPAANKQSRIVTHLQYRIRLPDHDWVVAEKHKLIPSVYAVCGFLNGQVGYSGPTFISIRSAKHNKSDAAGHRQDFDRMLEFQVFYSILYCITEYHLYLFMPII